jgi:predicted ATPase
MSYNFESDVPKALGQLLKTETDYNVIIYIGEEPNFKEFHAHSIILRCRSEYFNKIFSDENIEKKDGKYIIKKPNISPQAFDIILK